MKNQARQPQGNRAQNQQYRPQQKSASPTRYLENPGSRSPVKSNAPHIAISMSPKASPNISHAYIEPGISRDVTRKAFVRKVLFILMIQLAISTAAIGATFVAKAGLRDFVESNRWLTYVAAVIAIAVMIVLVCFRSVSRKVPINYIMLLIYTVAMSYVLLSVAAITKSEIVLFALGFTVAVVVVVSLYACFTKNDLTKKGYIISGLIGVAFMLLLFGIIFRSRIVDILYSALVGLIFTILLAIDIQKLTGKYENEFSLDEYIIAALDLYIDIVQIFMAVLSVRRGTD